MARIRTIKPEFFTSLTVADLTPEQRLTFIGLWTHVDDEGRCVDDARLIKAAVWPLDDRTAADIEIDLKALSESSLITRYTVNRKRYLSVRSWSEHQRINRPTESKLPGPEQADPPPPTPPTSTDEDSPTPHGERSEHSRQERKGKEGNREGKGTPLPPAPDHHGPPAAVAPDEGEIHDRMTDAWWQKYRRTTAQPRWKVRKAIKGALDNGLDPAVVWAAVDQLGDLQKPVTDGTLQFALSAAREASLTTGATVVPFPGQQPGAARPSTADQRAAAAFALSARLEAEEGTGS